MRTIGNSLNGLARLITLLCVLLLVTPAGKQSFPNINIQPPLHVLIHIP